MSTFAELYSDFKDTVKIYTEKLDVTPFSFMRRITRGAQVFQRESEYMETYNKILRTDLTKKFQLPDDVLRMVEVRDSSDRIILQQGTEQLHRNYDQIVNTGRYETPVMYSRHIYNADTMAVIPNSKDQRHIARMYAIWNYEIELEPDISDTELHVWYIPDVRAISSQDTQWSAWFPWEQNGDALFNTMGLPVALKAYEHGILNWTMMDYLISLGSRNYQAFQAIYERDLKRAIDNKPVQNREMKRDYYLAPNS